MGNACARPGQQDVADLEGLRMKRANSNVDGTRRLSDDDDDNNVGMHGKDVLNSGNMHDGAQEGSIFEKESTYDSSTGGYVQNATGLNITDQQAKAALTGKRKMSMMDMQSMAAAT